MGMTDKRQVMYDIERCTCHVPDACRDCSHYTGTVGFKCMENLMSDALALLKEQETVVRCIDCKHHRENNCEVQIGVYDPNWFCADAERR